MRKQLLLLTAAIIICSISYAQNITTIAGNHIPGYTGNGGPATAAELNNPADILMDSHGNLIVSEYQSHVIRKIDGSGIITTIAGTGAAGYSGDGGPATAATLNGPCGIAITHTGELYFCDYGNSVIRKIDTAGLITTIAGNGSLGYSGDGGPATAARLNPTRIAVRSTGAYYIADYHNNCIRMVNTSGIISTVAGNGTVGYSGDGGPATAAQIYQATSVVVDQFGNLYICDQYNQCIRKVNTSGVISTIAGNGTLGYSGDGGPATAATFHYPSNVNVDFKGNIYISDAYNNAVRMVDPGGYISTIAGNGSAGYSGDGGPATAARLNEPWSVTFGCQTLFIADALNNVVRKVDFDLGTPPINGDTTVTVGATITLNIPASGGYWSSSSSSVATVGSGTGIVTGLTPGSDTISYTTICGTSTYVITVLGTASVQNVGTETLFSIAPNPSKGELTISATIPGSSTSHELNLDIFDMTGRKVYSEFFSMENGTVDRKINLDNSFPNGLYIIRLRTDKIISTMQFSLCR